MTDDRIEKVAIRNGRQARVCLTGPDDGTPVVYLHGIPASCTELLPPPSLLASHSVRMLHVERPGFGESDGPPVTDFHHWVEWLEEVLDRLEVDRCALMGLSTGGVYALAMAALRPRRVSRLVLCETPAPMVGWDAFDGMEDSVRPLWELAATSRERLSDNVLASLSSDPERLVEATRATLPQADLAVVDAPDTLGRHSESIRGSIIQGHAALTEELTLIAGDWGFQPESVTQPTVIFHGDLDQNIPPSHARQLADAIPDSHLRTLPGYGHYGLFHPPVFESMLKAALG